MTYAAFRSCSLSVCDACRTTRGSSTKGPGVPPVVRVELVQSSLQLRLPLRPAGLRLLIGSFVDSLFCPFICSLFVACRTTRGSRSSALACRQWCGWSWCIVLCILNQPLNVSAHAHFFCLQDHPRLKDKGPGVPPVMQLRSCRH
jgi:hypothetical protein